MCRSTGLLLALLLLPIGAGRAQANENGSAELSFAVYAAGLNVLNIRTDVDLRPDSYRIDLNLRTAGLFGALFRSDINSFVQGLWHGTQPAPERFASWGVVRGAPRETVLDYRDGQPVVTILQPPADPDRDPVPPAMEHDTIDTLSAMAMLVRDVAASGRCEGKATTFDGRRVLQITAHTAGMEVLQKEGRSSFAGPALRCDFDGLQTAGFQHDESEAGLHRVHHSTAWLAPVLPGRPDLPVRVMFETNYFGHAIAYLTRAAPMGPGPLVSGASR
jgi:hypothetical protein